MVYKPGTSEVEKTYVAYRERWLFLANIMMINAGCFMTSYAFGPISVSVTEYYEVDGDKIDLIQARKMPILSNAFKQLCASGFAVGHLHPRLVDRHLADRAV